MTWGIVGIATPPLTLLQSLCFKILRNNHICSMHEDTKCPCYYQNGNEDRGSHVKVYLMDECKGKWLIVIFMNQDTFISEIWIDKDYKVTFSFSFLLWKKYLRNSHEIFSLRILLKCGTLKSTSKISWNYLGNFC